MLGQFYQWYIEKIIENPFIVVLGSLVALFAAIGSVYGGIQAIRSFYGFINIHYFENKILYGKLLKVNTGLSIDFIGSVVGKPVLSKKLFRNFYETIYIHKWYFLRIIIDNNQNVIFYSITTRHSEFNLPISLNRYCENLNLGNLRLGKMKLADMKDYYPEEINIDTWGMSAGPYYNEKYYFGNPGNYKTYFFEYSSSGCGFHLNQNSRELDTLIKVWHERRGKVEKGKILEYHNINEKILCAHLLDNGIGPNFYDIREF